MKLAEQIYQITEFICIDYPKHKEWYFGKQLPGLTGLERNILFVRNPQDITQIIAMTCLKKTAEERKICTLYVDDKCRGQGIGSTLVENAMQWLETTKPFITLADYKLPMFESLIKKYGWELKEKVKGFYNNQSYELCFNGALTKECVPEITPITTQKLTTFVGLSKPLNNEICLGQ